MTERISVIIPTYNRAGLLGRAVESVLAQTYTDIEIIIVDDASEDNTEEICMAFCATDSRVRYIKLSCNGGAARARNEGVRIATGEWIAFQDSDDRWYPQKLEKQMAYAEKHSEFPLVYCPFCVIDEAQGGRYPGEGMDHLEGDIFAALLRRNTVGTPTMLMRKSVFEEVGRFDESFCSLEDWEFVLRCAKKFSVGYVNSVLMVADYRRQERLSVDAGSYFEGRLRLVAMYYKDMVERDCLDEVLLEIFQNAKRQGCLEHVMRMAQLLLQKAQ